MGRNYLAERYSPDAAYRAAAQRRRAAWRKRNRPTAAELGTIAPSKCKVRSCSEPARMEWGCTCGQAHYEWYYGHRLGDEPPS